MSRAPPTACSTSIAPLFVSVPELIGERAMFPLVSEFVSVIVPAFVNDAVAVTRACSALVLSMVSVCAGRDVAAEGRACAVGGYELAPLPV